MALQHARAGGDQNVTSSVFYVIVRLLRHLDIYPNERTMACALMPANYFVVVVLPSRQIKRVFVTIFSGLKIPAT